MWNLQFEQFASFYILGFLMLIGYLIWRMSSGTKEKKKRSDTLEERLREAEHEARLAAKKKGEESVLEMDVEDQIRFDQAKKVAESLKEKRE